MKILVVDDDISLCGQVAACLVDSGYKVEVANSGADALMLAREFGFDVILLDIGMPDMSGVDVCAAIRKEKSMVPIIFLTGNNGVADKEIGLDLGADDYITKPFDTRELLARISAVTRRAAGFATNELTLGNATLLSSGRILKIGSQSLILTATEFGILEFLMRKANQSFTSKEIFKNVWPSQSEADSDTVRVHVRILRKKLELLGITNFIKRNSDGYFVADE